MAEMKDIWGGPSKKKYYTPDGREYWMFPQWREYQGKDSGGKLISGTRDANYDIGLLDNPPQNPKLYCKHCDKWHDTKEQVEKCGKAKRRLIENSKKRFQKDTSEVESLRGEIAELKEQIARLANG